MSAVSPDADPYTGSRAEWLAAIPSYQRSTVEELLGANKDDPEKAADIWLTSTGGDMIAGYGTAGGERVFLAKVKAEVREFVCGGKKYDAQRKELFGHAKKSHTVTVSLITAAVATHVGTAAAYLVPIVALLLMICGQIGKNAWCSEEASETKP